MVDELKPTRCKGQTKAGKPCGAAPTDGGLCFFHANPSKAAELGRIGGRKNGRANSGALNPSLALNSVAEIRNSLPRLIDDVCTGRLHPRRASALAILVNLQLRAIVNSDLEQRLAKVENLLAEREKADAERIAKEATEITRGRVRSPP